MKKYKIQLIIILIIVSLVSIFALYQKVFKETPENIMSKFKKIKSYKCNVEYTIRNPRGETSRKAVLESKGENEILLKFTDGMIQQYKNKNMILSNENNNEKFVLDKSFDKFYKLSFIEYMRELFIENGEDLKVTYNNQDNLGFLEVEYKIYDNSKELNRCKLFVSTKTCAPEKLIIYDDTNNERVIVKYENFVVGKNIM